MARAHDCDSGLGDRLHISAYIKDERRIVNLLKLGGIGGIIQADDGNSGGRNSSHFVMGQFHGLTGAERLRRHRLNAGCFEFGQRCLENVADAAKCSASRRARVGPNRGVRERASHCKARLSLGLELTDAASATQHLHLV